MAVVPRKIILNLQMAGAMVLIITGYFDRLEAIEQPDNMSFPLSYIALPVWTGALVSTNTKTFYTLNFLLQVPVQNN